MESINYCYPNPALNQFLVQPDNQRCVDCSSIEEVEWASLGFGTFLCLQCAGFHRSLGTHLTSVRSIKLDSWDSSKHVAALERGGNARFLNYIDVISAEFNTTYSIKTKYENPRLLYYTELISAIVNGREPRPFDEVEWTESIQKANSKGSSKQSPPPKVKWFADSSCSDCMICFKQFSIVTRRHHCRRCGRVVCSLCAPSNNTRPIFEMGFRQPVRHCRECFQSPAIDWQYLINTDVNS